MHTAASRVAKLPAIMSIHPSVLDRFDIIQPIVSPGIAAGVYSANTHIISDSLNCTALNASPAAADRYVKATYIAAITPACVKNKTVFFVFFFCYSFFVSLVLI